MTPAVEVIGEPITPHISFSKRGLWGSLSREILRSWALWFYSLIFSLLALHLVLVFKFIFPGNSPNWFLDVFANTGIIMVSAIMAITAFFEFLTRKRMNMLAMILLFLVIFCYSEYSMITVNVLEAGQDNQPIPETFARINLAVFLVMLVLGSLSFLSLSGFFERVNEYLRESRKK